MIISDLHLFFIRLFYCRTAQIIDVDIVMKKKSQHFSTRSYSLVTTKKSIVKSVVNIIHPNKYSNQCFSQDLPHPSRLSNNLSPVAVSKSYWVLTYFIKPFEMLLSANLDIRRFFRIQPATLCTCYFVSYTPRKPRNQSEHEYLCIKSFIKPDA